MIDINDVYKVYDKHLYLETYHLPIIAIATYITKDLPGKPLWVVPVAPSSYGKTTITSFVPYLEKTDQNKYQVYCMDQLTSKAFASGLKVKGNKSYGELLQNQNSMIYFSDMASLLVSEDSKKIFAMFRTLYDGEI
ncbi:MAG: hypothetical protein NTX92_02485, partial [Euryarchaeota archaeon]|nr:hypothetical protein [Euryarchaeota archaeon]